MIHPIYMPFTREQLGPHFADERNLDYFVTSAIRYAGFMTQFDGRLSGMPITKEVRLNRQIEKDERFWTTATLKAVFESGQFASLLGTPPNQLAPSEDGRAWEECVGERADQRLYFEVAVSSPEGYRQNLRARYRAPGSRPHPVPYVVDAGAGRTQYEGATKLDAVFVNEKTDFCVLFESKVMSDISCNVTFDPFRNQLARNIDVLMDRHHGGVLARLPERRILCLLSPELFRANPSTRYYGLLFQAYKHAPDLLAEHLPHRDRTDLDAVRSRLGWLTFEDCMKVCPGCCPWLAEQGVEH